MAKGRKTGGRDFVPGDTRAGRPPLPEDVKTSRKLTSGEFQRLLNKYLWLDEAAIDAATTDPACSMLEKMVASIIKKGIVLGDPMRMEILVTRLVGKVTDKVEVTIPKPFVIAKRDGSTLELGAKVDKESDDDSDSGGA